MDVRFLLGVDGEGGALRLESVEEVMLDGCQLPSSVRVSRTPVPSPSSPQGETPKEGEETNKPLLPLLSHIFPSLTRLDLSYNVLTTLDGVEALILPFLSFLLIFLFLVF